MAKQKGMLQVNATGLTDIKQIKIATAGNNHLLLQVSPNHCCSNYLHAHVQGHS